MRNYFVSELDKVVRYALPFVKNMGEWMPKQQSANDQTTLSRDNGMWWVVKAVYKYSTFIN